MRTLAIFFVILGLAFPLAAVGHDVYLQQQAAPDAPLRFVSAGWALTTYAPEAHAWVLAQLEAQGARDGGWAATALDVYGTLLAQPLAVLGLWVMGALWLIALALHLAGKASARRADRRSAVRTATATRDVDVLLGRKSMEVKYKRR
jgi:hypothetical protein